MDCCDFAMTFFYVWCISTFIKFCLEFYFHLKWTAKRKQELENRSVRKERRSSKNCTCGNYMRTAYDGNTAKNQKESENCTTTTIDAIAQGKTIQDDTLSTNI